MLTYRLSSLISLLLIATFVAGCDPTIPDLKPYAEATAAMTKAINLAYDDSQSLYGDAIACTKGKAGKTELNNSLKASKANMVHVKATLTAMVEYSDSLVALAEAGNKGKESVDAVANSLNSLIGAAAPLVPFAAIPTDVINLAGVVYSYVAKVRARKNLREATEEAAPAVNKVAEVLTAVMQNMSRVSESSNIEIQVCIEERNATIVNYYKQLVSDDKRAVRELTLISQYFSIADGAGTPAAVAEERYQTYVQIRLLNVSFPSADHASRLPLLKKRRKELVEDTVAWREERARIQGDYETYSSNVKTTTDRAQRVKKAMEIGAKAVQAWAKSHTNIQQALEKSSRRAAVLALVNLAKELSDIYNKGDE